MLVHSLYCFEKVFDHLVIVGFQIVPLMIAKSYFEEGVRFTLADCFLESGKGLIIILPDSNALAVTSSKMGLTIGITYFSSYSILSYSLR